MKLMRLQSEEGRWAYLDNSQIYRYVVYLMEKNDVNRYHLIDDKGNEIYKPTVNDIIYSGTDE